MFHFEKKILGAINTDLNCQSRHDLAITLSLFIAHTRDRQKGGCQRDWNWWDGRTWLMRINGQSIIREGPIELNIITKIPIAVFGGHWKVFYPFSTRKEKVREFLGAHRIRTPLARWRKERHLSNCGILYRNPSPHQEKNIWMTNIEWVRWLYSAHSIILMCFWHVLSVSLEYGPFSIGIVGQDWSHTVPYCRVKH